MNNPLSGIIERTREISFQFDGVTVSGYEGETIAAALLRAGIINIRNAPNGADARGIFCVMGVCQECVVKVNGKIKEACRTEIKDGLVVERISYV